MRPARLTGDRLAVVLVAHGSRDPRAAAATEALARAVRGSGRTWDVRAAYLDHAGPRPLEVLGSVRSRRAVLVPLLLTSAYHGRVDIPRVLQEASSLPLEVRLADVLGPLPSGVSPLLIDGLARRLFGSPVSSVSSISVSSVSGTDRAGTDRAGTDRPGTGPDGTGPAALDAVVLAAAGTRDAAARRTVEIAAEALRDRLGVPCTVAYASASPPAAGDAVRALRAAGARRVGMASYFLAPGLLYDAAVRSAREAGAVAVAPPLGDAPELVRLVAARVAAACRPVAAAA